MAAAPARIIPPPLRYTSVMLERRRRHIGRFTALVFALFVSGMAADQLPTKLPDIHFVPTPQPIADAMLTLARVTPQDVVYDLGSGDGRSVILAAQKYGARGVGIELDARLVEISRQVAREGEVSGRVTFIQ